MTDLTTIGEVLIDLTQTGTNQQGVPLFAANPGGAPANGRFAPASGKRYNFLLSRAEKSAAIIIPAAR